MKTIIDIKDLNIEPGKFTVDTFIKVYKKVCHELIYSFNYSPNNFFLEFIDLTDNYGFFTLRCENNNPINDKIKIWAFNNETLWILNLMEGELKEKLFDEFKSSDTQGQFNVVMIDNEGKKEDLVDISKQTKEDTIKDITKLKPTPDDELVDIVKQAPKEESNVNIDTVKDITKLKPTPDDELVDIVKQTRSESKDEKPDDVSGITKLKPTPDDELVDIIKQARAESKDEISSEEKRRLAMKSARKKAAEAAEEEFELEDFIWEEDDTKDKKEDKPEPAMSLKEIMDKLSSARSALKNVVLGQDAAIDRFISGLFDILAFGGEETIKGSFLFIGPSGTGKTLLAKEIAKVLNMDSLVVNLSEYSDKEAISRFRGFDKTFKDSRPGLVTSYIYKHPKTVIIFDEVDKAHSDIKNLLLQLYNDGIINDPQLEKNVSFKDTILVFTTNAGKKLYEENDTDLTNISNKKIINALKAEVNEKEEPIFPSALISRFSSKGIVVFNYLEPYTLFKISDKAFKKKADLFSKRELASITYDKDLITAFLYNLGGKADGRNLVGLVNKYIEDESIEALRQLDSKDLEKIKKIDFTLDKTNNEKYFSEKASNVLLFMPNDKCNSLPLNIEGIKFYNAFTLEDAKALLRKDIDFIIIDIETNMKSKNIYNDIEDIDSDGRDLITYCNTFHSELPIYILNDKRKENEFATLIKIGIKGIINIESFKDDCTLAKASASMAKNCYTLKRANQVLQYRTRQKLVNDAIIIEMYNLKFVIDYNVEDDDFVMDFDRPTVKFSDVIGNDDAKETLHDFIRYLNNPVTYLENGVRAPRGILLFGPPGTGKTLLAKALAGESTVSFIQKNASDFVNKSPDEIEKLFNKARKYAPAIIFLDEVDAIAKERMGYSSNEPILNKLLSELDGFKFDIKRPVIVVAATNYPIEKERSNEVIIDPAFVRRFDRKIKIDLPDKEERIQFINYYLGKHSITTITKECIENVANRTIYYSPADLEQLIEHAIRNAKGNKLTDLILSNTVDENKNGEINKQDQEELKRTAIHESGHALICYMAGITPAYLTIVSRSGYGGYMAYGDNGSKAYYSKADLLDRIRIALGGRAAEIIMYGEDNGLTTGPSSDLYNATTLAKSLIASYGMNDSLVSLEAIKVDDSKLVSKINEILNQEFAKAKEVILNNKAKYDKLVDSLLERNSLTEKEIVEILK